MNNERRKKLSKALEMLRQVRDEVEALKDEEQEALENMPDAFRDGERGEKGQAIVDNLENAFGNLEEAITDLEAAEE